MATLVDAPVLSLAEVTDAAPVAEGRKRKTPAEIEAEHAKAKEAQVRRERQRRGIYASLVDALQSDESGNVQEKRKKLFLGKTRALTIPIQLAGKDGNMREVTVTVSGNSGVSKDNRGSLKVIIPGEKTYVIQSWDAKTTHAVVAGKGLGGYDAKQPELDQLDQITAVFNPKHQISTSESPGQEVVPQQADQEEVLRQAA